MEIINKIIARGKAFALTIKKDFDAIQSPVVRLAILFIVAVVVLMLIWKALPVIIFLALVAAVWVVAAGALADDEDQGPRK